MMTLKRQYFEKSKGELQYIKQLTHFIFLSAYMENTPNGEKVLKFYISQLIREQREKKQKSSLSIQDWFE